MLQEYLKDRDNLQAGLSRTSGEAPLTVWRALQPIPGSETRPSINELNSPITFADDDQICTHAAELIGKTKSVKSLGPPDFDRLHHKLLRRLAT